MKKTIAFIIICALLALAGCQGGAAADSSPGNGGSAPADDAGASPAGGDAPSDSLSPDDAEGPSPASPHAAPPPRPEGNVVEIKEKMFIAQTNDIYYNADDYLGKILKYEGLFDIYTDSNTGVDYYFVIRYGPGCCGIDANAGFEVAWDKGYPNQDDWVEAVGVLEDYEEDGVPYLRVALSSLTVLDVRGAEVVTQ